tara:strand:+ start:3460 stop:4062 length:603 start_codon:yes stop_codon:yes gene_type:complete
MNAPAQLPPFKLPKRAVLAPVEIWGDAQIDDQHRWWLRRWWSAGPYVCWIMLNPSTADASRNDPTLHEVIRFTRLWGFGGLVVVNLYPFISSSPAACRRWAKWGAPGRGPDWYVRDRLWKNEDVIAREARAADLVVAAWGAGAWDGDWVNHVIETVQSEAPFPALHCLGKTASGAPKHPLARGIHRVPRDQSPIIWRKAA